MKVFPLGVSDANACISAFFAGHTAMMVLSTGSLSFVRDNMKMPYEDALSARLDAAQAAQCRADRRRLADPAEGQYPGAPKTPRALIGWLRSREIAGEWSRFTGYFAPHRAAYDLPEMKDYLQQHPDAKVALDQLQYAVSWFETYNPVAVRKAIEDQVQAILSGNKTPADAVQTDLKSADKR